MAVKSIASVLCSVLNQRWRIHFVETHLFEERGETQSKLYGILHFLILL